MANKRLRQNQPAALKTQSGSFFCAGHLLGNAVPSFAA